MYRRTLLGGVSTLLLAGCSDLQNTFEDGPPDTLVLGKLFVVNNHAASRHRVTIVVVADDERVFEETVELAPDGELGNNTTFMCEFPEERTEFEVRAVLPNGTEGSINTTETSVNPESDHVTVRMQVQSSGNIDAKFFPLPEAEVPQCGATPTTQ